MHSLFHQSDHYQKYRIVGRIERLHTGKGSVDDFKPKHSRECCKISWSSESLKIVLGVERRGLQYRQLLGQGLKDNPRLTEATGQWPTQSTRALVQQKPTGAHWRCPSGEQHVTLAQHMLMQAIG